MKTAVTYSYTFTPAAKTVDLSSISGFDVKKLYAIINTTANQVIFANGQSIYGLASISGSVLTLSYNTTAMSSTDKLMIIYDDPAAVQAISAGSLPLPTGAATETTLSSLNGKVTAVNTGAVVISSSALPTGAATAANQATANASLSSIDSKLTSPLTVTGPLTDTQLRASPVPVSGTVSATNTANGATGSAVPAQATQVAGSDGTNLRALKVSTAGVVSVDGSAVTQPVSGTVAVSGSVAVTGPLTDTQLRASAVPVSGTVTANAGTGTFAVSAASLPLPTGAATEATLSTLNGKVVAVNTGAVVVASSALPSGASTSALQTAGNASLSSIDGKTPALGQALAAASVPVVLTAAQVSTLTPLSSVTVTQATGSNLHVNVDSLPSIPAGSNAIGSITNTSFAATQATASALNATVVGTTAAGSGASTGLITIQGNASGTPIPVSGSITATNTANGNTGSAVPTQATQVGGSDGANLRAIKVSTTGVVSVDGSAVTQPVSGTVAVSSLPSIPTGANTIGAISNTSFIATQATGTNLHAVIDSGTVTANAGTGTFAVSAASLPLPTGAATETTLAAINTKLPSQGQALMAASQPVVIASNQSTIPVSVSSVTSAQAAIPGIIADVASAALTTTTTTATLTPTFGSSYSVTIPVTVVSGTAPTLDVQIQESDDTGTNWVAIYDFPRITATGFYRSPVFPFIGNRIRYVQTVSGTTPSFTRAINRLQSSLSSYTPFRQQIDRSIVLTTLNSTTPSLTLGGAGRVQLVINIGATTIAPVLQLEGSDDNGATWYSVGTPLTSTASRTVQLTVVDITSQLVRARASTAGTGTTAGYVMIKAF